ncbi:MAG: histidinol-phosphatase, partial [Bacteroidetes bacterium]|nr:histidinol-phosphatase [Bacteroidota bacterium]
KVIVDVEDAQGRVFQVRRILNENHDLYYNDELQPGVSIPIKKPLFFGQKELVLRGSGLESELVERLLGSKLDAVRREIAEQHQRVLDVLGSLDKLKDIDNLEAEHETKRKDTEFRLKLFKDYGVEDKLNRQVQFQADVTHAGRVVEKIEGFIRSVDTFLNEQEAELSAVANLESKENKDIMDEMNAILERIRKVPERIRQVISETRNDNRALKEKHSEVTRRREALKEEFAAIERQLSEKLEESGEVSVRPDDFVKLNKELQNVKLALAETAKSRIKRTALRDELLKELKRLNDLWHHEFKQIEVEVRKMNEGQTALQIIPTYKGDRIAMLEELKNQFRGSRLREATLESILEGHADFISVYQGLDGICNGLGDSGEVFRKYFNDAKALLVTWKVPHTFQIMYHGKELRDHSLGQRASALVLFILNQRDNDLIVIDQPEDDLDNQTIFEDVIKLLRSLKVGVQFIFATHNANFPVLGDAEQVGACSISGTTCNISTGSIDQSDIQTAIVSIMEGGKEAFARRKEIYQLWKQ